MRLLLATLTTALILVAAPTTGFAAWFPADPIDGPGEIEKLGGVDLAREGTGALAYIKRDGGVPHLFVSRRYGGVWRSPERVDVGQPGAVSEAAVAAIDRNRVAVVWIADGRVFGSVTPVGDSPGAWTAPALLYDPGAGPASGLSVDMAVNGVAYATFSAPGVSPGDVRALRLARNATAWDAVATPLNIIPSQTAGIGANRARVATSADGNAVVVWGESHPDGRNRVYSRRLLGLRLSAYPQEISLADLGGVPGGAADTPEIGTEDDGAFGWAVFRQDIGGSSRAVGRRLLGTQFEPPTLLDAGGGVTRPRLSLSGKGAGIAAVTTSGANMVVGSPLESDVFGAVARIDSIGTLTAQPVTAVAERGDSIVAWRNETGGGEVGVRARLRAAQSSFEPEVELARPGVGDVPPDALAAAGDRNGNFSVVMLQGPAGSRWLQAAAFDRPPVSPVITTPRDYFRTGKPRLTWESGHVLWGAQQFKVFVDDKEVVTTSATSFTPPVPLTEGPHRWRVIGVDRHGQQGLSAIRYVRVDTVAPTVRVKISGKRKRGQTLKFLVTANDGPIGSGVGAVHISFGDSTPTVKGLKATHRYRRSGRFAVVVKAWDRAGNVTVKRMRVRVKS